MKKTLAIALVAGIGASAAAQPSQFTDLGKIGNEGTYTFDTNGSLFDTEMALWDAAGILLAADDDGGDGLNSLIVATLSAGTYYLGVSEFNSFFEDGFINSGSAFEGGDDADVILNIDGQMWGQGLAGEFLDQETLFFCFDVSVPAPGSMALLGLGGLAAIRRRR